MRIGQKIRNIHTKEIYTIVDIESVNYDSNGRITVYEVSNDVLESHRFNANYVKHYEVINDEEEE